MRGPAPLGACPALRSGPLIRRFAPPSPVNGRRALLRRLRPYRRVVQHRPEPAFDLLDRHALARRVVLDLIALDFGDAEIMRLRMGDVEAGDRGGRPHRVALGELDPDRPLGVEQPEEGRLLGMVGLGGIARRGADAAIGLGDQLLGRERFVRRVAPELAADACVHRLGEGFRQPVAERLDQNSTNSRRWRVRSAARSPRPRRRR